MIGEVKFLLLDVDGTLTDGGIYISDEGKQFKKFNAKDGMGIRRAFERGIEVGIISHASSGKMIDDRAEMLGLKYVYVGQRPKMEIMNEWLAELNIEANQVAYMGDDLNDIEIMRRVWYSACPADACDEVIAIAQFVMKHKGGAGAVREFIDNYLLVRK